MRSLAAIAFLVVGLFAGCRHSSPNQEPAEVVQVPPAATIAEDKPAVHQPALTPAEPPVTLPPKSTTASVAKVKPPPVAPKKAPSPSVVPAPIAPSSPAKPQLDFKSLEQRLRDTSAIGVFTKLSIKNQVDDLLKAFRGYHAGQVPPSLDELRQRYDGLLLKVVTLVQNGDATLAASISASRGAIWEILSNRESFQAI